MEARDTHTFQESIGRIEEWIQALEHVADPAVQDHARALVQAVLDLHGAGLERMLDRIGEAGSAGRSILDALLQDDLVGNLLLLHDLHPLDLETRIQQALTRVRPYLGSHGGNVALLGITPEGGVRLRLEGSCHGCPSSRVTLQYAIEEALYEAAPDITALEVEGAVEEAPRPPAGDGFIPLALLAGKESPAHHPADNHAWVPVDGLASLTEGSVRTVDVAGGPVLFCRVGQALYAYNATCPHCSEPLDRASLAGRDLSCPACGHRYDVVRAGQGLEVPGLHLAPYPLLVEQGRARVAVPAANVA